MEETWSRNLLNMMTTPLREIEYVVGLALYGLAKLAAAMATVSLAALALLQLRAGRARAGALVPLGGHPDRLGLGAGACSMIGLLLRYGQSAEILTWATPFLSSPCPACSTRSSAIPGPLQPVARAPADHLRLRAPLRDLLDGKPMPWGDLGWGALGAVVLVAVDHVRHADAGPFRRRGYVTRYS